MAVNHIKGTGIVDTLFSLFDRFYGKKPNLAAISATADVLPNTYQTTVNKEKVKQHKGSNVNKKEKTMVSTYRLC